MKKRITKNKKNIADRLDKLPTLKNVDEMFQDVNHQKEKKATVERKKFGTQLKPELITKLKMRALQEDMTITNLLEEILNEYLE